MASHFRQINYSTLKWNSGIHETFNSPSTNLWLLLQTKHVLRVLWLLFLEIHSWFQGRTWDRNPKTIHHNLIGHQLSLDHCFVFYLFPICLLDCHLHQRYTLKILVQVWRQFVHHFELGITSNFGSTVTKLFSEIVIFLNKNPTLFKIIVSSGE